MARGRSFIVQSSNPMACTFNAWVLHPSVRPKLNTAIAFSLSHPVRPYSNQQPGGHDLAALSGLGLVISL